MSSQRLEDIETKIAFLEQANAELSEEIVHQKRIIDELRARLESLSSRIESAKPDAPPWSGEQERPPHY